MKIEAKSVASSSSSPVDEAVFSLGRFESVCYARQHEAAAREFVALLGMLDRNYGGFDAGFHAQPTTGMMGTDQDPHIINRICSALSALFSDPAFNLSFTGYRQLLYFHRWIATLFAASSFRNADHILRALNIKGPNARDVEVNNRDLVRFCLLYTPNSEVPMNMEALWQTDRHLAVALACALLSPRFLGTAAAHDKREVLLQWLPPKLDQIEDLDVLPIGVLHDIYMHCSYADTPQRHAIKAPINRLVRKKLTEQGIKDVEGGPRKRAPGEKPLMLVILEWFSGAHSIYRTHSASIRAARQHFHVVGIGHAGQVDDLGKAVFDEYIEVAGETVSFVRAKAQALQPDIVYYPAFGMFPHSIYLTNLRLAPVQVVSYGHPATSMSPVIDYFVLPEDWVGDPACFSEKLLPVPKAAMPFVPSVQSSSYRPQMREYPEVIRVAIAATTMKLNPGFVESLVRIQRNAGRPVEFHFFTGTTRGLVYLEARDFIRRHLPDAFVHPIMPYAAYMEVLNGCDLYLNPFPFGNTNGIVDVTTLGLAGVCKTGPEVLEHIDEALFIRVGLPEWLIARSVDDYENAAVRLITDDALRLTLRRKLLESDAVQALYGGEPELFGQTLETLLEAGVVADR
ncbi:UDP-glucose:protein N-beta-glucosyltransferase [Paraburkholderia sacchari]|uniref:peptide transporter n=1 Tax=Paraburkholderia sacchari TaxID=159450 RepID=UPI0039A6FF0E